MPVLLISLVAFLLVIVPRLQTKEETEANNPIAWVADQVQKMHNQNGAQKKLTQFAHEQGLSLEQWPDALIALMEKNPDTESYVLNYPLKKDEEPVIDLSKEAASDEVPQLYQWDERWGYQTYGEQMMGLSGCGPTCLSMVCIYLKKDATYHPKYVAEFSIREGYCVPGSGSAWSLISEGGKKLGLDVVEIPLNEKRIRENLQVGNPIICIMGPGTFTDNGHFIVLAGYEDGKIKIHDPNSKARSERLWTYEEIEDQIRDLWVCRK